MGVTALVEIDAHLVNDLDPEAPQDSDLHRHKKVA